MDWLQVADQVTRPVQVLAVLLAVLIARWLAFRVIDRVVAAASARHDRRGGIITGRAGQALAHAAGLAHERYVQRTQTMGAVLRSVVTVVVSSIGLLTAMAILGIPLAPLLASAGVGGLALGFGAQSLVRDFISGVFMIVEDQYGVGDVIDTGSVTGTVEDVSLRVTRIRDAGGVVWYVRNGEIVRIGNRSQGWSTAVVRVPLVYGTDVDAAVAVVEGTVKGLASEADWAPRVLEPPGAAGVESLETGVVMVALTVRCAANADVAVEQEIRRRVTTAFRHLGIELGVPPVAGASEAP
ncbi:MAG: mechanosensitive ion channel domain-containing protein [Dermatophilaceae bacterium]